MRTIASNHTPGVSRAFIADGQANEGERLTVRNGNDPMFTTQASQDSKPLRAFVVSGSNTNANHFSTRGQDDPHTTVTAQMDRSPSRAYVGRVVKMNIKALGRFQTVPDSYIGLTTKINGNGFPCLLAEKILKGLIYENAE